eukprot:scaffold3.g6357.t1
MASLSLAPRLSARPVCSRRGLARPAAARLPRGAILVVRAQKDESIMNKAKQAIDAAKEKASEVAETVKEAVGEAVGNVKEAVTGASEEAEESVKGAVAEVEGAADKARSEAGRMGKEAEESVKGAVDEAASKVRGAGEEAGLQDEEEAARQCSDEGHEAHTAVDEDISRIAHKLEEEAHRVLLPVWEESVKTLVRGWFAVGVRSINTFSAAILELFPQSWRNLPSQQPEHPEAWRRWWATASGTFNFVLEREGLAGPATPRSRPATPRSSSAAGARTPSSEPSEDEDGQEAGGGGARSWGAGWHRRSRRWLGRGAGGDGGAATPRGRAPRKAPHPAAAGAASPAYSLQRGDALFELPSGFAISEALRHGGLVEEARLALELGVSKVFDLWRSAVRAALFLGAAADADSPAGLMAHQLKEGGGAAPAGGPPSLGRGSGGGRWPRPPLESMGAARHWEDLHVWTASDVILRAGYPLEEHTVTTSDEYILQMHRIPRHGARDVAFFQHGVLDTSLGWVANGSVGSSAFAAYDSGFDVWLANSRANAPRLHTDKAKQGSRYWVFTINQMATCDIAAQVNHIHQVKMAELEPGRWHNTGHASSVAPAGGSSSVGADSGGGSGRGSGPRMQRAATDSALGDMRRMEVAAAVGERDAGEAGSMAAGGGDPAAPGIAIQVAQQRWSPLRRVVTAPDPLHAAPGGAPPAEAEGVVPVAGWQRSSSPGAGPGDSEPSASSSGPAGAGPGANSSSASGGGQEVLPYRLQAVGHSLGAACLLIYAVVARMQGQPHHLRRLILMSPAGFHSHVPIGMRPFKYIMPAAVWLVDRLAPGRGLGLRLPSPLLRYITFRFAQDLHTMPALHDLVRTFMRAATSGDNSQWDQALTMPHYNASSMPALAMHCGAHFAQWARDLNFRLYDYGSAAANAAQYGSPRPPSVADHFDLLDVPVDLLGGEYDGVISANDVRTHYERMQDAGVRVTFRVMSYGHMDFTMSVREDIREFVLGRLLRPL